MTATSGSTRVPISRTTAPSTDTRPAAISSSLARRLADSGPRQHLLEALTFGRALTRSSRRTILIGNV